MATLTTFEQRAGATFRAIINDLKRNEEAAARELGVELAEIQKLIQGERLASREIIEKAVRIWPVNERDFFPIHDDALDGVIVMRKAQSAESKRIFQRGGYDYYEYRDTAMTHVATIRPEWIKMLHVVDDADAENPSVQWNNGHFLYQFTYFIGPVNYYYGWNGRRLCAPMATGDSVFGLPFAQHSFASRNANETALILALTYGGRLAGDAQQELSVLGKVAADKFVLPGNEARSLQAAIFRMHANNGSYSREFLAEQCGMGRMRLEDLFSGNAQPTEDELNALADAFHVAVRELIPCPTDTMNGVSIVRSSDAPTWCFPCEAEATYRIRELAGSRITPYSKSLELEILRNDTNESQGTSETLLHEYVYNHGESSVLMAWTNGDVQHEVEIEPGDSIYVKPCIRHWFKRLQHDGSDKSVKLLLLRVGGKLTGDTAFEATAIGGAGMRRIASETQCWYNS